MNRQTIAVILAVLATGLNAASEALLDQPKTVQRPQRRQTGVTK